MRAVEPARRKSPRRNAARFRPYQGQVRVVRRRRSDSNDAAFAGAGVIRPRGQSGNHWKTAIGTFGFYLDAAGAFQSPAEHPRAYAARHTHSAASAKRAE